MAASESITRALLRHPVAEGAVVIAIGLFTMLRELPRSQPQMYLPISIIAFGALVLLFGRQLAGLFGEHLKDDTTA